MFIGSRLLTAVLYAALLLGNIASSALAQVQEFPKLQYWPGVFLQDIVEQRHPGPRLSSDGRYVRLSSDQGLSVFDRVTRQLVFNLEILDQLGWPNGSPLAIGYSSSGNVFVVVDVSGKISWYRMASSVPIYSNPLDSVLFDPQSDRRRTYAIRVVDDSTAVVEERTDIRVASVYRLGKERPIATNLGLGGWLRDSLAFRMPKFDSVVICNPYNMISFGFIRGGILGVHDRYKVIFIRDDIDESVLCSFDVRTGATRDILSGGFVFKVNNWYPGPLMIRDRYVLVNVHSGVYDLDADTIVPLPNSRTNRNTFDFLPELGTLAPSIGSLLILDKLDGTKDTIPNAAGQIKDFVQDPRDSTIYLGTFHSTYGDTSIGEVISLRENEIVVRRMPERALTSLGPFQRINGQLVVPFESEGTVTTHTGTALRYASGYMSFDNFRNDGPRVISQVIGNAYTPFVRYSENGDTLFAWDSWLRIGSCQNQMPADFPVGGQRLQLLHSTTGFISGTDYYTCYNTRYRIDDCAYVDKLPFMIMSISRKTDRVMGWVDSVLVLSSISNPSVRLASYPSPYTISAYNSVWAHNGTAFRFIEDSGQVVTMYSSGRVTVTALSSVLPSTNFYGVFSNDGNVLTFLRDSLIMSVDVESGEVLRSYSYPLGMNPKVLFRPVSFYVADIDGRIVVVLPSGSIGVTPGIDRPVSVLDEEDRSQTSDAGFEEIRNALPGTDVLIYNVIGQELYRIRSENFEQWNNQSASSLRGAYFLVYTTKRGVQTQGVLR